MTLEVTDIKELMSAANGDIQGDLLIKNIKLLDVYSEKIIQGSIMIKNGRIVAVNPSDVCSAINEFDGDGQYALPGFIEPHFHIDSTLATPAALSEAIVPWGTTTLCAEILDITHFAGIYGENPKDTARAYLKDFKQLPYSLLPMAPGKMSPIDISKEMLSWDIMFGLGEMLPHNLLYQNEDYMDLISEAKRNGKFISGHVLNKVMDFADKKVMDVPCGFHQISTDEINQFPILGYSHDHEIFCYEDVVRILERGMCPLIRTFEGLIEKIIPGVVNNHMPTENLCFSIDDLHIQDIKVNGHLSWAIQQSIDLGMSPIKAIKMATLNNAKLLGLERSLGSLTPGRVADIVLVDKLSEIKPTYVFKAGNLVAKDGSLLHEPCIDYSLLQWGFESHLQDLTVSDLEFEVGKERTQMSVFNVKSKSYEEIALSVENGKLQHDTDSNLLYGVVVDRSNDREIKKILLKGFKINKGAIGISFGQNANRVIAAGNNLDTILTAVKKIDRHLGGLVTVEENNNILEFLELDVAAVASSLPCNQIVAKVRKMEDEINNWGGGIDNVFMTLWFLGFLFLWE